MDMDMSDDMMGSMAVDQRKPTHAPGNNHFLAMGGKKGVFPQAEECADEDGVSQPPTKKAKQEGTDSCLAAVAPSSPFERPDWHTLMSQYQQVFNQDQQAIENQQLNTEKFCTMLSNCSKLSSCRPKPILACLSRWA
jgi:hypothetical protein